MVRSGRANRLDPLDRFQIPPDRVDQGRQFLERLADSGDREPPIVDREQGWNFTPLNEPVDPYDCRRWPNSPFCEGNPPVSSPGGLIPELPRPLRPIVDRFIPHTPPIGLGDWGLNNCEAWVCAQPSIGGWEMPPICAAYRWGDGNCVPDDPPPDEEEEQEQESLPPGSRLFRPNRSREGWVPGCKYIVYVQLLSNQAQHDTTSLRLPGRSEQQAELDYWTSPVGGREYRGWILPCYGPVTGIEIETWTQPGSARTPAWSFRVFCGGMGLWTNFVIPFNVQTLTPYVVASEALLSRNWVGAVSLFEPAYRYHRPASLLPRIAPPNAIWHRRYGEYPIATATGSTGILSLSGQILPFLIDTESGTLPRLRVTIVPAADLPRWNNSIPWGVACAPTPVPPPPLTYPRTPEMAGCSCADIEAMIDRKLLALLGFNERRRMAFNPENLVKTLGDTAYANFNDPKNVDVGTVPQLVAAILATNFYRGGYHRFPATVPNNLAQDDNIISDLLRNTKIHDAMSWNEWEIKQLDGLVGAFPLFIKYKNAEGEEKEIKLHNMSETLAELVGVTLSLDADTDVLISLAFKSVLEAIGARIAATTATDYAAANAEYLGYRTKQERREVKVSINTGTNNVKEALEEATRIVPKVKFDGKTDQQELFDRILVACEIIKAVFYKNWNPDDMLPGDRIREEREGDGNSDTDWASFITAIENPAEGQSPENAPRPDLRNIITPPSPPSAGGGSVPPGNNSSSTDD